MSSPPLPSTQSRPSRSIPAQSSNDSRVLHDVDGDRAAVVDRGGVALDPVVAELPEDHVVLGAAGDDVGAERAGGLARAVVEEHDPALLVGRVRVELPGRRSPGRCRSSSKIASPSSTRKRGLRRLPVRSRSALSPAIQSLPAPPSMKSPASEPPATLWPPMMSSSSVAAGDPVGALAAEDDVVAGVAADQVVAAALRRARVDRGPGERMRGERHAERQQRERDVALDLAVVAEDQVVAGVAGDDVAGGAAEDDVVALVALDRVGRAHGRVARRDHVHVRAVAVGDRRSR